jgi:hypothetical protein
VAITKTPHLIGQEYEQKEKFPPPGPPRGVALSPVARRARRRRDNRPFGIAMDHVAVGAPRARTGVQGERDSPRTRATRRRPPPRTWATRRRPPPEPGDLAQAAADDESGAPSADSIFVRSLIGKDKQLRTMFDDVAVWRYGGVAISAEIKLPS